MNTPLFHLAEDARGTVFHVRVSPGASREKIAGEHGGALKISLTAAPEKGKANSVLVKLLAGKLGVERRDLTIVSGETRRDKRLLLHGRTALETETLLRRVITT